MERTEAKASLIEARIGARKARLVADLIRSKQVDVAINILNNTNKKASNLIKGVLESAISNAVNNFNLDRKELYINQICINDGPVMKRVMMDSRGHVGRKDKRTSHINILVGYKTRKEVL